MPELPEVETVRRGLEPVLSGARLSRVRQNRRDLRFPFPERFPALGREAYDRMVNRRATRDYFVGNVYRLLAPQGPLYGFSVLVDDSDPAEHLGQDRPAAQVKQYLPWKPSGRHSGLNNNDAFHAGRSNNRRVTSCISTKQVPRSDPALFSAYLRSTIPCGRRCCI